MEGVLNISQLRLAFWLVYVSIYQQIWSMSLLAVVLWTSYNKPFLVFIFSPSILWGTDNQEKWRLACLLPFRVCKAPFMYIVCPSRQSHEWGTVVPVCVLDCVWLFATLWLVSPSGSSKWFFRQEYWADCYCPPPGDLPHLGMEPASPVSPALQAAYLPTQPLGSITSSIW